MFSTPMQLLLQDLDWEVSSSARCLQCLVTTSTCQKKKKRKVMACVALDTNTELE